MADPVVIKFITVNNVSDVADLSSVVDRNGNTKGEVYRLVNVDPDNDGGVALRTGFAVLSADPVSSGWSDGKVAYIVQGGYLKKFDGTTLSTLGAVLPDLPMDFCAVNDVVVYSNGIDFGVIEAGRIVPQYTPSASFFERMKPGEFLEFYNGRLYSLSGSVLYCSAPLDVPGGIEVMDTRSNVVAVFSSRGAMLKRVEHGLYVGSETEALYFGGPDPQVEGLRQKVSVSAGVVPGSAVHVKAELVSKGQVSGEAVIWLSPTGVIVGFDENKTINLSLNKVSIPCGTRAAAIVREQGGLTHYVVSLRATDPAYNTGPTPIIPT